MSVSCDHTHDPLTSKEVRYIFTRWEVFVGLALEPGLTEVTHFGRATTTYG